MKRFLLCLMLLLGAFQYRVVAQNLPINIETLTDQQIMGLMTQYQLVGLSELELEMKAREKGLSMDQINQLKKRMALMDFSSVKNSPHMLPTWLLVRGMPVFSAAARKPLTKVSVFSNRGA